MKKRIIQFLSVCLAFTLFTSNTFATNSGIDPLYYVCIGDSVAAGYSLPGVVATEVSMTSDNYKNDTEATYPHIVAEKLNEIYGYTGNLYDNYSNMSTVAAQTTDVIGYLEDPEYCESLLTSLYKHPKETVKFHDLYVEEISKADMISVNVGNNDLLVAALTQLWWDGVDLGYTKVEYNGYTIYDKCKNPIIATVYTITNKMAIGIPLDAQDAVAEFKNAMEWYLSDQAATPLTLENTMEAIEYMQSDHLAEMMRELAKDCEATYPTLINDIRAINNQADMYLISYFAAFGNSLEVNGKDYTKDNLFEEILQSIVKGTIQAGMTGNDVLETIMNDLVDKYTYPMIYLLLGNAIDAGVQELNSWLVPYCKENGYTYVDIYGIPNEDNLDPHPNVEGHQYIADQLVNAMTSNVTVSGNATVTGPSKVINNRAANYTVELADNQEIKSVTVNGKNIAFNQNSFSIVTNTNTRVEVKVTNSIVSEMPFTDVLEGKWYYSIIQEAYSRGLMTGKTETTFDPNGNMTRGMVATVIYRLEGKPFVSGTNPFTDVASNKYYTDAITWCYQNGIVKGKSSTSFDPAANITRQELVIMLRNYAKYRGMDVSASVTQIYNFPDGLKVSSYAREAMAWAVENGLISGDQGYLKPKNNATRAQCAKMILATDNLINE